MYRVLTYLNMAGGLFTDLSIYQCREGPIHRNETQPGRRVDPELHKYY